MRLRPTGGGVDVKSAADWLCQAGHLLLVTHVRPDGDAVGSLIGLHSLLESQGVESVPFMNEPVGSRYSRVVNGDVVKTEVADCGVFDAVCAVDCGNPERLDLPSNCSGLMAFPSVINIDHHPDNRRYGQANLVVPKATATAEILVSLAESGGWPLSAQAANALLLGLVTDCGTFRFANTSAATFESVAKLLRYGADYASLVDALHFRDPPGLAMLRCEILERACFEFDGRLVWSVLEQADLNRHGLNPHDTENLIDVLRSIDSVEIACLLQPEPGYMRYSLRSRGIGVAVGSIARALGGGGHEAAAGARIAGISLDQAVARLKPLAEEALKESC